MNPRPQQEFFDEAEGLKGEVSVRPFRKDGSPLSDPYSIFKNPDLVKANSGGVKSQNDLGYINLSSNLVVNLGRQTIANLIGGKDWNNVTPNKDWIINKASWGTYDEAARFTDSSLSPQLEAGVTAGGENEILYDGSNAKKPLNAVDWPAPFIVRFEAILGADEAVGYLIREMGLWTDNDTLFARKTFPPINKSGDFGLSFLWRIRS
jgi:hypothetical protein